MLTHVATSTHGYSAPLDKIVTKRVEHSTLFVTDAVLTIPQNQFL